MAEETLRNLVVKIYFEDNRTKDKIEGINKEMDKTKAKGMKLHDQFKTLGKGAQSLGRNMTLGVTLPIIGLGAAAINSSIEIESAFAGIRKTVDGTADQLQDLKETLDGMATDTLPIARTELYGIAEAAGQLGVKIDDIDEFSEVMAKLGVTTDMSGEEAATSLARFANITQMDMDYIDELGSTVVDLGNNLASTEAEITQMGLRLAGAGEQVGMAEAEIMSFAGALSSVGIEAEAGGSAFSRVMINMNTAVMGNTKEMKKFAKVAGMSAAEFGELWKKDAAQGLLLFIEGLGEMTTEGKDTAGVLDDLGLSEIRTRDALLRASGAGDLFRRSLELGNTAWSENNALNKEASERFKTTASQIQLAKNNLGLIGEQFGNVIMPTVNEFLVNLKGVTTWLQNMDDGQRQTIVRLGLFVAAIGPVLFGVGSLMLMFLNVSSAVTAFGGVTALLASPLGWIPLAIGGIIIAGGLLIANWNKISEWAKKLKDTVVGAFEKIGEVVSGIFGNSTKAREINIGMKSTPALADGTRNWGGGSALVAEAGAELVTGPKFGKLPKGSNVYNNRDTEEILNRPMRGSTHNTFSDVFNPQINITLRDGSPSEVSKVKREVERQIEPALEKYFYKLKIKRPALSLNE
jgi:TP901 family phage tail tape measure protein